MQCKDILDLPILKFLAKQSPKWSTWGNGYSMPTIQDTMPPNTPKKLQLAKMKQLMRRELVSGCGCGCRGDFQITQKGSDLLCLALATDNKLHMT